MNIKHQSMKKIKKKKFLLQQFKHKPIKSLDISEILLSEDDSFFIKGNFHFLTINANSTLDLYQIKSVTLYHFQSPSYVHLSTTTSINSLQESLHQFQQQTQTANYQIFLNYLLQHSPHKPTLLLYGEYQIKKTGHFLSEQQHRLLRKSYASVIFLGEKGAGKSTTLQQYANYRLNQEPVFLLDTDLGQSLSLPGFITLFKLQQPLFLSPPQIIYQGFVGEFQVQNHIQLFINKLQKAMEAYQQNQLLRDYPLLINTAGFVTNYGVSVIQQMIAHAKPQLCLILAHSNQKVQVAKAHSLGEHLKRRNFLDKQNQYQPNVQILIDEVEFDDDQKLTTSHHKNPQQKKLFRLSKIGENIGVRSMQYLDLCQAEHKVIDLRQNLQFIVVGESLQINDAISLARLFCFQLVALENDEQFLGLGFIKDIDVAGNEAQIITKVDTQSVQYIIKSKYFDCHIDNHDEINLDQLYRFLDNQQIAYGHPIPVEYEIPYLNVKSEAIIGDRRQLVKVNKKKF